MTEIRAWDPAEYLGTPEEKIAHLNVALEDGDPVMFQVALGDVVRSRGMAAIAREAGVGRDSLYESLFEDGNSSWLTVMKVLRAFGLQMEVKALATR